MLFVFLLALSSSGPPPTTRKDVGVGTSGSGAECDFVRRVGLIPMKGEPTDDPGYNEIVSQGCAAVPRLLACVTDETAMRDPRQAPAYPGTRSGDVAIWMLEIVTKHSYEQELPEDVRAKIPADGIYAYFRYVKNPSNREALRKSWEKWIHEHPCLSK